MSDLSSGARRLLNHLQFLSALEKGAIKFQRSLAIRFKVCTRTIRRWLTELRICGQLAAIVRRGRTSARYEMSTRMSTQEPQNVHSNSPYPLERELSKVRRPPQRETTLQRTTREAVDAAYDDIMRRQRA